MDVGSDGVPAVDGLGSVSDAETGGEDAPSPPPAVSATLYAAALEAKSIIVFTESQAAQLEVDMAGIAGGIKHAVRHSGGEQLDWRSTGWTADSLEARYNFRRIGSPTISCVYRTSSTSPWYEVLHVYAPPGFECDDFQSASIALDTLASLRFESEFSEENGTFECSLVAPTHPRGESYIDERGSKSMQGAMLAYGARHRRARQSCEKVPGCSMLWPDRFNASAGTPNAAITTAVDAYALALGALESEIIPAAGAARAELANELDPSAKYRVAEGNVNCSAFALMMTQGFVVSPHDDSGAENETLLFSWPSDTPLPPGHQWCFAVAGCIHPLPTKPSEAAFISLKGKGIHHGTLPTSGSLPHLYHPGIGSALVTKSNLVKLLREGEDPNQPWPTRDQLERRKRGGGEEEAEAGEGAGEEAAAAVEGEAEGTSMRAQARAGRLGTIVLLDNALARIKDAPADAAPFDALAMPEGPMRNAVFAKARRILELAELPSDIVLTSNLSALDALGVGDTRRGVVSDALSKLTKAVLATIATESVTGAKCVEFRASWREGTARRNVNVVAWTPAALELRRKLASDFDGSSVSEIKICSGCGRLSLTTCGCPAAEPDGDGDGDDGGIH
jgi:hypothetical protein